MAIYNGTQKISLSGIGKAYVGSSLIYQKTTEYSITVTLTNATASASNPSTILQGSTATLVFTFDGINYKCPSAAPTVTGATGSWTKDSDTQGTMVLSSPTANVSFTVSGEATELTELCFTANTAGSTVELRRVGNPSIANTAYSYDRQTWTTFTPSTTAGTNVITLANVGDKVYFRNDITANFEYSRCMKFFMTGSISASGNVNSMYDADDYNSITLLEYSYCYTGMFYGCTSLTTAPELPATTLADNCYNYMFRGCTSLTTAPELPATTLADGCYRNMFYGCTSLTTALELPATTLADNCYNWMFRGCTSLTTAPELPATTLADNCYTGMFYGCTSLTTAPELPATTLADNCYSYMFYGCTSLTTAPELPATTLAYGCYDGMFYGCTALYVSDTSGSGYDKEWKIPSSGTFTNETQYDQTDMFSDCLGTRSSDSMTGAYGESHTYYTQNEPV